MLEAVVEVKKHHELKVQWSVVQDLLSQTVVVQTEIRQLQGNCKTKVKSLRDAAVEKDNVEVDGNTSQHVYALLVKAHVDAEFTRLNQNIHR